MLDLQSFLPHAGSALVRRLVAIAAVLAAALGASPPAGAATPARVVPDAEGRAIRIADASRIVCLGPTATEVLYAIGAGGRIVGADESSTFPAAAARLPRVGYQRTLSAEGVLSLRPTLIIGTTDAGPPPVIAKLRESGVAVLIVPSAHGLEPARARIRTLGAAVGASRAAEQLVRRLDADLARLRPRAGEARPKVLFIYARGAGSAMVSGRGTAGDEMIRLAGGENVVSEFEGFRPITAEAVIAAAPDVILAPTASVESVGGVDALLALPGLSLTPAGRSRRVIQMDALYLLGFGPRLPEAIADLGRALRTPEAAAR